MPADAVCGDERRGAGGPLALAAAVGEPRWMMERCFHQTCTPQRHLHEIHVEGETGSVQMRVTSAANFVIVNKATKGGGSARIV